MFPNLRTSQRELTRERSRNTANVFLSQPAVDRPLEWTGALARKRLSRQAFHVEPHANKKHGSDATDEERHGNRRGRDD